MSPLHAVFLLAALRKGYLTGDLQVVQVALDADDPVLVLGLRSVLDF